jgi:hypothetical protein
MGPGGIEPPTSSLIRDDRLSAVRPTTGVVFLGRHSSTEQPNAITPSAHVQALAMAVFGSHIGFGAIRTLAPEPKNVSAGSAE